MLTYNGVTLRIETSTVEETAWYSADGKDLLGTHFVINCRSVWSPFATSSSDQVGIASVAALRQTLMTPRKQLVFSVPASGSTGTTVLLRSPYTIPVGYPGAGTAMPCDSNNGPCPISFNVVNIQGERTVIVDYSVETWITECTTARAILSHKWATSNVIDQDGYTTRLIRGLVVFRRDWIAYWNNQIQAGSMSSISGDMFRFQLFPTIPGGFKRDFVNVNVSPDGTNLDYEVRDTQQTTVVIPELRSRISRVEGTYTEIEGQANISPIRTLRTFVGGVNDVANNAINILASGGIAGITGLINTALNVAQDVSDSFPVITTQLDLEVWGTPDATKQDIIRALLRGATAFNFAGPLSAIADGAVIRATSDLPVRALFQTSMFAIDLSSNHARFQAHAKFPSYFAAVLRAAGLMPGTASITASSNFPSGIKGLTSFDNPIQGPVPPGQGPGYDNQSRATYIQEIATAALRDPCTTVVTPDY